MGAFSLLCPPHCRLLHSTGQERTINKEQQDSRRWLPLPHGQQSFLPPPASARPSKTESIYPDQEGDEATGKLHLWEQHHKDARTWQDNLHEHSAEKP